MLQPEPTIDKKILEGEKLFEDGNIEEAEIFFSDLLKQNPSSSEINNNLGAISYVQGNIITAKEYFLSALSIDKNNFDAFSNLKEIYKNYGSWEDFPSSLAETETTTEFFKEAFKLDPKDPGLHNDIGIIQLKASKWDDAEKSFLTAIYIDPTYQEAFYNLGRVFFYNERYIEAIDNFIAATILNPDNEISQKAVLEYQNKETIKRIGEKYKSILIVGEDLEQIAMLIPALKAIKELHPAIYITITILGHDSNVKEITESHITNKAITQTEDQAYDLGVLTVGASQFLSQNKTWLNKNCKQVFLYSPLKDQNETGNYFHIARCFGFFVKENKSICEINNYHSSTTPDIIDNRLQKKLPVVQKLPSSKKQFFIGGTGRSGTTILQKILNYHGELASFGEVKVLHSAINDLQKIIKQPLTNRNTIVEEFKNKWLNEYYKFYVTWQNSEKDDSRRGLHKWFDKNEIVACLSILDDLKKSTNLTSAFHIFGMFVQKLFDKYAIKNNKCYWVEKTPPNVLIAPILAQCFPNFKIVNIIRDGRDVACSMQKMAWGIKDPFKALDWWANNLTKALEVQKYLAPGSFLNIRYEDLVEKTERTLKEIISFFNLEWDANLLNKPIYSKSINRYKNEMDLEVQKYASDRYGNLLRSFNYDTFST